MFRASEVWHQTDPAGHYAGSVELCTESGDFITHCLIHLHNLKRSVRPLTTRPEDWEPIKTLASSIDEFWADRDPAYGRIAQGQLWSASLTRAYLGTREIVGNPLDFLPPEAAVHIRSAAALRMARSGLLHGQGLDGATRELDRVLASRSTQQARIPIRPLPPSLYGLMDTAETARQNIATIPYFWSDIRAVSDDAEVDKVLAILEGAARSIPTSTRILDDGLNHPHPLIRQTATQLNKTVMTLEHNVHRR